MRRPHIYFNLDEYSSNSKRLWTEPTTTTTVYSKLKIKKYYKIVKWRWVNWNWVSIVARAFLCWNIFRLNKNKIKFLLVRSRGFYMYILRLEWRSWEFIQSIVHKRERERKKWLEKMYVQSNNNNFNNNQHIHTYKKSAIFGRSLNFPISMVDVFSSIRVKRNIWLDFVLLVIGL